MITKRSFLAATASALSLPHISSKAYAALKWQMAIGAPETNYLGKIVREFVDDIAASSNNELQIQLHPRGSLLTQPHIMRGVRSNQIQLGKTLLALHGNEDPFFELEGIPFLADTWEDTIALQTAAEPFIKQRLESRGLTLLFSIPWTGQGFYTNSPVTKVSDLKDTRLRIYNPVTSRMATLAGARPVNIVAGEIPQAFASGIINAMFTSAQTGVDFNAWDFTKIFTEVGGMRNRAVVIANTAVLNLLPVNIKTAILEASKRANEKGFVEARKIEVTSLQTLRSKGIQTSAPTAELMRELRGIGTQLAGEWVARTGQEGSALMTRYRELQRNRAR